MVTANSPGNLSTAIPLTLPYQLLTLLYQLVAAANPSEVAGKKTARILVVSPCVMNVTGYMYILRDRGLLIQEYLCTNGHQQSLAALSYH